MILIIFICAIEGTSIAENISELKNKKAEAVSQKQEITAEKNSVLDDISELNLQISQYENELDELKTNYESKEYKFYAKT